MKKTLVLIIISIVTANICVAKDPSFEGLGDLPGGGFSSQARGVSADGSVVVGRSNSTSGDEAFRWQDGKMTGLGDLPGGTFSSYAFDVSANGAVVVGRSFSGSYPTIMEAFRWEDGVMTGLGFTAGYYPIKNENGVICNEILPEPIGFFRDFLFCEPVRY